jgi:hypothetical protein
MTAELALRKTPGTLTSGCARRPTREARHFSTADFEPPRLAAAEPKTEAPETHETSSPPSRARPPEGAGASVPLRSVGKSRCVFRKRCSARGAARDSPRRRERSGRQSRRERPRACLEADRRSPRRSRDRAPQEGPVRRSAPAPGSPAWRDLPRLLGDLLDALEGHPKLAARGSDAGGERGLHDVAVGVYPGICPESLGR